MTDELSRLARLEEWRRSVNGSTERMAAAMERMANKIDCLEAAEDHHQSYRERIERMENDFVSMHDIILEWVGALKFVKWAVGFIGFGALLSIIGFVVQLFVDFWR